MDFLHFLPMETWRVVTFTTSPELCLHNTSLNVKQHKTVHYEDNHHSIYYLIAKK